MEHEDEEFDVHREDEQEEPVEEDGDADALAGAAALELFHSANHPLRGVKTLRMRLAGEVETLDVAERASFVPANDASPTPHDATRPRRHRQPRARVPPTNHEDDGRVFLPDADGVVRPTYTSKYTGVSWHKYSACWMVQFRHHAKRVCVGYFHDEEAAALAYDKAVSALGLQRPLNFPGPGQIQAIKKPPAQQAGDDSAAASAMLTLQEPASATAASTRKRTRVPVPRRHMDEMLDGADDEDDEEALSPAVAAKSKARHRDKDADGDYQQHPRRDSGRSRGPSAVTVRASPSQSDRAYIGPPAASGGPQVQAVHAPSSSTVGMPAQAHTMQVPRMPAGYVAFAPAGMYYHPSSGQSRDAGVTTTSAAMAAAAAPSMGQYPVGMGDALTAAQAYLQAQYYDAFRHMAHMHAAAVALAAGAEAAAPPAPAAPSIPPIVAAPAPTNSVANLVFPRVPTPADARAFAYPRATLPHGVRGPGYTPVFTLAASVSPPPAGMMMHSYPRTDSVASLYAYATGGMPAPSSHTNISSLMQQALARPIGDVAHRGSMDGTIHSPAPAAAATITSMGSNPAMSASFSHIFNYEHDTGAEARGATQTEGYVYFS